jgi:hypothetical protein
MTDMTYTVLDVAPEPFSLTPRLIARVGIATSDDEPVQAIALRCQVRIEPLRRGYSDEEAAGLADLFGPRERWANTQRTFLWQHSTAMVPGFTNVTETPLPLECTYDFEVAASKYLHALGDGEIPLTLLFSGTVLAQRNGALAVQPVAWHVEAHHRMPVAVWRDVMDQYFPNSGWIRLRRETIDALTRYKAERAIPSWDDAFEMLLKEAGS